ncbi:MAG TPA: hypothetical protein DCO72_05640 [Ruminococcus sp.]|nr:hypothetical protein [Ruminococcus sp.]
MTLRRRKFPTNAWVHTATAIFPAGYRASNISFLTVLPKNNFAWISHCCDTTAVSVQAEFCSTKFFNASVTKSAPLTLIILSENFVSFKCFRSPCQNFI